MNKYIPNPIEQKVIDFLKEVGAPNVPSQIAAHVHETAPDTERAVLILEREGLLFREPDFTFLRLTGESVAFGLKISN